MWKQKVVRHAVEQPDDPEVRLIPLTRGYNATVDASDYDFLMQRNWHVLLGDKGKVIYARSGNRNNRVLMHRALFPYWKEIDHIDGDGLNNRRSNLRDSTHANNMANRGANANNTSGYKGVFFNSSHRYWHASIRVGEKTIWLGICANEIEAARRYDQAAIQYCGDFARTNFPRTDYLEREVA